MGDCLFCNIVNGEIPACKFWENEDFIAILDINPNVEGMSLVITKKHYQSYIVDLEDKIYSSFLLAVKEVAKILDKKLNVHRTSMVMEGTGINHAHIKLYPMHGMTSKDEKYMIEKRVHFDKYPGYITTLLGPEENSKSLEKIKERINSVN